MSAIPTNPEFKSYQPVSQPQKRETETAENQGDPTSAKKWKTESLNNDSTTSQRQPPYKGVELKMDIRSALYSHRTKYFDQVIRFEEGKVAPINALTEAESKLPKKPTDKVFVQYESSFGKFSRSKWYPAHYNEKGEAKAVYMMGPMSLLRTRWFPMRKYQWTKHQQVGTYGVKINGSPMANAPDTPTKASFWYGISTQSYFGDDTSAQNPHVTEFLAWRRHLNVWIFREMCLRGEIKGSAAVDFAKYRSKTNTKPIDQWTDAEWFACYDTDLYTTVAPLPMKDGQPLITFETAVFFPHKKATKPNEKPPVITYSPIPEIAAVEREYDVEYSSPRMGILVGTRDAKTGQVGYKVKPLTEQQKWDGPFFDGPAVVAAATFTPYLSSAEKKGETVCKYTMGKEIIRVGDASNPLPWASRGDGFMAAAEDDQVANAFADAAQADAFIQHGED